MLTAEDLERVYALYSSSRWRGDTAGETLEHWFRAHWVEASPHRPESDPAAVSPHGAGGRGIFWYEGQTTILGFVPGKTGGYVIKRTESAPTIAPPKPARGPRPVRLRSVAHFQAGTYARHLLLSLSPPTPSKE